MDSKYKVNNHSILNTSNDEAKQGASWNDIVRSRADRQHPHGLLDGDIHKPVKYPDHHQQQADPQETAEALHTIEDQIKHLQAREEEKARARIAQQHPPQPNEHHQSVESDSHDDWRRE
jgi:hypothetical protein